jgi:hypothetical protein
MRGKHQRGFGLVLWVAAALALSCAGAPKKEDPIMTVSEFEKNAPSGSSQSGSDEESSSGSSGEQPSSDDGARPCVSNDDCGGKGWVCGFDPDKSRVQRYCMPE